MTWPGDKRSTRSIRPRGTWKFDPLYRTDVYAEQRGLEQVVYDQYPGAALNRIRPISVRNPNYGTYMQEAEDFLAALP